MFRRLVDVGLDDSVPDHGSIWRFRQKISEENLLEFLFDRLNQYLTGHNLRMILRANRLFMAIVLQVNCNY